MTYAAAPEPTEPSAEQVSTRSELLPEESAAGSEVPAEQAATILAESGERTEDSEAAPDSYLERRTSDQATGAA
jgi:hypothetical protein